MIYLLDGVKVGLILSLLTGPIFLALIQTGIEKGLRAGVMVGMGVWMSDILFILGVYFGLSYVKNFVSGPAFALVLGITGGILLIGFGLWALFSRPLPVMPKQSIVSGASSWLALWLKGFLINTINPFTFFFWIGIAGVVVVDGGLAPGQSFEYFAGIVGVVVVTDFLKVVLAKRIRRFLRPIHLLWMRRISGSALIVFGLALMLRVIL